MGEIKAVKSLPIKPFAMMGGTISGLLAVISGILTGILGILILITGLASGYGLEGFMGFIILIAVVIGSIIASFIIGFIYFAIIAFIYNFLASKIGGIELELE